MNVGYIYKITNTENNLIYIGSTIQSLTQRYNEHKCRNKNPVMYYKNPVIQELEQMNFNKIEDLKKREQYYLNLYDNKVNIMKAYESYEEKKIRRKNWREKNKDKINKNRKLSDRWKKIANEFLFILL